MSQLTVPTQAAAQKRPVAPEPQEGTGGRLTISPSDIGERLWRIFTSMRTALILMLILAVLALVGTLVIQAPSGMTGDSQAYQAWLDSITPKYGGWTGPMNALGLFSIFSSVWFKGIIVLLTTSVLACSVNRFKGLWKTAIHPRTKMTPVFYDRAPHSETIDATVATDAALADVTKTFKSHHFRTVVERDGDEIAVYADRYRWAPFGTLMAHISLVMILVGALVGGTWGFNNGEFAVPVGSTVEVGNGTGLAVKANSFNDSYYENGAPSDYAADLVLYKDGQQVAAQTVRVNQPLGYGDVNFYQSFFGAATDMTVTDAAGKSLFSRGVPLLYTASNGTERVGQFLLPEQGLTVIVVTPASGEISQTIRPGQVQVEVYKTGDAAQPIGSQVVTQGQPVEMAGLTFAFDRERQFTGLIVAKDPGVPFVFGGALLLIFGLFLVFFFPSRRIWTRIVPGGAGSEVRVGATSRHDATFGPDFQKIVGEMKSSLVGKSGI
jgi:cytochrome c biogenesis protein